MSQLESALNQIRTARLYTKDLLTHIDDDDWFRQPSEGVTNVAWQVGISPSHSTDSRSSECGARKQKMPN